MVLDTQQQQQQLVMAILPASNTNTNNSCLVETVAGFPLLLTNQLPANSSSDIRLYHLTSSTVNTHLQPTWLLQNNHFYGSSNHQSQMSSGGTLIPCRMDPTLLLLNLLLKQSTPVVNQYLTPFDHLTTASSSRIVQLLFLHSSASNYWNPICSCLESNDELLYSLDNPKILIHLKSKVNY